MAWKIIDRPIVQRNDSQGQGEYGASRNNSHGWHRGEDIIISPGQSVYAPFRAEVVRIGQAYSNSTHFKTVWLHNLDNPSQLLKLFYVSPTVAAGTILQKGQVIGYAQDIRDRYGDTMIPHLHIEIYDQQGITDPYQLNQTTPVNPSPYLRGGAGDNGALLLLLFGSIIWYKSRKNGKKKEKR